MSWKKKLPVIPDDAAHRDHARQRAIQERQAIEARIPRVEAVSNSLVELSVRNNFAGKLRQAYGERLT